MPQVSGSFSGKSTSQAMVSLQDAPDHEMSLIEVSGPKTSSLRNSWAVLPETWWTISASISVPMLW